MNRCTLLCNPDCLPASHWAGVKKGMAVHVLSLFFLCFSQKITRKKKWKVWQLFFKVGYSVSLAVSIVVSRLKLGYPAYKKTPLVKVPGEIILSSLDQYLCPYVLQIQGESDGGSSRAGASTWRRWSTPVLFSAGPWSPAQHMMGDAACGQKRAKGRWKLCFVWAVHPGGAHGYKC